jgi:hypothetical protein
MTEEEPLSDDPFDHPDITIKTTDNDASMAVWEMANKASDEGDTSFDIAEKMEKSHVAERIHEIWLVVNDALKSGALNAAIYTALKPFKGKRISIRFAGRITLTRDQKERLESIGCEVAVEKETTQPALGPPGENQPH